MNSMFGNIDWEKQQKGVDQVKKNIKDWKEPIAYDFAKMFNGCSNFTFSDNMFGNVTEVDEKIIPQTQIMAKGLINEFLNK